MGRLLECGAANEGARRASIGDVCGTCTLQISPTHPKMRSGCAKKSVIRSRRDRGSSTKVGSAILLRSIPGRTEQVS